MTSILKKLERRDELRFFELQKRYDPEPHMRGHAQEKIEAILSSRMVSVPSSTFLAVYKCTRCGHEWDSTCAGSPQETQNCIMGCSSGSDQPSLMGLYKIIKGLITGKEPFRYGRLINSKEL